MSRFKKGATCPSSRPSLRPQCCPLLAGRVRDSIQRLVWLLEKHEHRSVWGDPRPYFKQDSKARLWLLWVDVLRLAPLAAVAIERLRTSPSEVWDESEAQLECSKSLPRLNRAIEASMRELKRKQKNEASKSLPAPYGEWPSCCRDEATRVELLLCVEDQLNKLLAQASERGPRKSKQRASRQAPAPSTLVKAEPSRLGALEPVLPLDTPPR